MEIGAQRLRIDDASAGSEARRRASTLAARANFDETEIGRAAIVASELASNIIKHAGRGELLVGLFDDETGSGVELLALDRGPGISAVERAMQDGYSTSGTAGEGLGAVARLCHAWDIYSKPGKGAAVLARLQRGARPLQVKPAPLTGAVSLAKSGEEVCGDAWIVTHENGDLCLFVADGLGHGPLAATASTTATRTFAASKASASVEILQKIHAALRPTRGAAASIAVLPKGRPQVEFIGVGNVAGIVSSNRETRRMVGYNGTLGHTMKTVQRYVYPTESATTVVLASDGLSTQWLMEDYPGLTSRHPTLIAAVLVRDFDRGRDDVTVLVGKRP